MVAEQANDARLSYRGETLPYRGGVDQLRRLALQPQDHGLVRAVPAAGGAERPVQVDRDPRDLVEQAVVAQAEREHAGGAHRAHGVRGRRADADREQVEDTDRHERHFLPITQTLRGRSCLAS